MLNLLYVLPLALLLYALDDYVMRKWHELMHYRQRGPDDVALPLWAEHAWQGLLRAMPLTVLVFAALAHAGAASQGVRIGFWAMWAVYYGLKLPVAIFLLGRDVGRLVVWLFEWFQRNLLSAEPPKLAFSTQPAAGERLDLVDLPRLSRKDVLARTGWSAAHLPLVALGARVFRHLYDYEIHHLRLALPDLPEELDGLTIAQLSDLHAGSFFSERPMHDAVDRVLSLAPDLVVITGDFVNQDEDELPLILPALSRLSAPLGVYGCLGNHDHYADADEVTRRVRAAGVEMLVNERRAIRVRGERGETTLHLAGVDNTGFRQDFGDLPLALDGLDAERGVGEPLVLLAHDPTFWDTHVRALHPEVDLTLAGHTHGGQVGFEYGRMRWGAARHAYRRWAGHYAERVTSGDGAPSPMRAQHLYVNRGLGTVGAPLRVGIRPEITLITLERMRNADFGMRSGVAEGRSAFDA